MESLELEKLPRLRYDLKNKEPVELLDLTDSLLALGDEYGSFLRQTPGYGSPGELKLYIREIRTGSIIADLIVIAPMLLVFAEHSNSVIEFGRHLTRGVKYLVSGTTDEPTITEKKSLENFSRIVKPVVKDEGSQLNVSTVIEGDVVINFDLTSMEASVVNATAKQLIGTLREPTSRLREKVVMYWYQARHDFGTSAGDKGIIESITDRPIKIVFLTHEVKKPMIFQEDPFRRAHVVDVEVETIQGRPVLYKVVNYHGTFQDYIGDKPNKGMAP